MTPVMRSVGCLLAAVVLLAGCYSKPVRHLASDAALIKVGQSTREDVLTYLGEPDEQVVVQPGLEKWLYKEYEFTSMQTTPLIGRYFAKDGYGTVTVVLRNDLVTECVYAAYDPEGMDWASDFDWQEEE